MGKGPDDAAKAIAKRFETSKSNAYRLVMTESAAIAARATEDCYTELGVEEFEVLETLDHHTCPICGEMDGKHFPQSQYEIGVTVPPFHPRCRGTTVPYFSDMEEYGERFARDLEGNTFYVSADTTYEQWKQMQDNKYGTGSVDKARQMAYNKSADLRQYEQYKKVLGADILGSEDEFRKKKYFDSKEFDKLKKLFKENSTYLQAQFPYIYNGEKLFIPDKTIIKSARTIAGAGSKTELRVEEKLVTKYGGKIGDWKKRVGKVESDKYIFDVHWYELNGNQYDMKLKNRSDKKI